MGGRTLLCRGPGLKCPILLSVGINNHVSTPKPQRRLKAHEVTLYSLLAVGAVAFLLLSYRWNIRRNCESNILLISQALDSYKTSHGELPMNRHQLVPDYLPSLPECPSVGIGTYRVAFGRRAGYGDPEDDNYYLIRCTGMEHDCIAGFPAYDTRYGMLFAPPMQGEPW